MISQSSKFYLILLLLLGSFISCKHDTKTDSESISSDKVKLFHKVSATVSGLDFSNDIKVDLTNGQNIMAYEYFYNGAGVGIGDFNKDGLQDIFMAGNEVNDRLYLNQGDFQFKDVTNSAGISKNGWSTGVSISDINQDGWLDIYVCRGGPLNGKWNSQNVLYINLQNGIFLESAAKYGLNDPNLSTQAAFFDYDRDGDLDAYVMNESPYARAKGPKLREVYQNQDLLRKSSGRFFINENNKFKDMSKQVGTLSYGYGLGLVVSDFNDDGWLDFYITNDYTLPDKLFINQQDGTFRDELKYRTKHIPWFAMGIDVADINNDNYPDMAVVEMASTDHVRGKTLMATMDTKVFWDNVNSRKYQYQYMFNSLQINDQEGGYFDAAAAYNVQSTDWSWAPLLADFDNDGYKDYYVTNGYRKYVNDNDFRQKLRDFAASHGAVPPEERAALYETIPDAKVANLSFKNEKGEKFVSNKNWGLSEKSYSNGAAYADLDNDGDLDLVVNNVDQEAFLYKNNGNNNYITIDLNASISKLGTKINCYTPDGMQQLIEYSPVRGYISSMTGPIVFGIGNNENIDSIVVRWPDSQTQTITNIEINSRLTLNHQEARTQDNTLPPPKKYFSMVNDLGIDFVHIENQFDDFQKEVLLPYRQSTLGPFISKGDINGDGLEDFFVGGARGQGGKLYLQTKESNFRSIADVVFAADAKHEDMGSLFFDADGDGDQDLYVVSGGNSYDFGASLSQDRLYINQGNGKLEKSSGKLPLIKYSGSRVVHADLDGDGDEDLIVGGRLIAQEYPITPKSYILINEGGTFKDKTEEWSAAFAQAGLVNDLIITDLNGDKKPDLVVAGEWMKLLFLENNGAALVDKSAQYLSDNDGGWWYRLHEVDVDDDGDLDIIAGNLGLNSKYKTSKKKPFEVLAKDFDNNGVTDIVLTKEYNGKRVPVRGKECSTEQMPFIKEKFPSYEKFATSSIDEILGTEEIDEALKLQVTSFQSVLLLNEGGSFTTKGLPRELDYFPVMGMGTLDIDKDGKKDLLFTGNIYQTEVETPRIDSGNGLVLINKGEGNFTSMLPKTSGYKTPADAKDLCTLRLANGKDIVLVSNNGNIVQQFVMK